MTNMNRDFMYLFYILFFAEIICSVQSLYEGQPCVIQLTGRQGTCKESSHCPTELELIKYGLKPTVCQKQRNKLIICCAASINPNPFSLIGDLDNPDDSDVVRFPDDPDTQAVNSNQRISERKCLEYSKVLSETVNVLPLVTNPRPVSVSVANCDKSIPLIVGGIEARPGEFPHMAALGYYTEKGIEWKCGGTLVSEEFVVTAAHCIKGHGNVVRVRLGGVDLSKNNEADAEELGVAQVIVHPQFRPPYKYNDIALIRLSRAVTLSKSIVPACLKNDFEIKDQKAWVTGWGTTDFAGDPSVGLMKVALTLVSNAQCEKHYSNLKRVLPNGIQSTMVCAGEKAGGKDACQGDSGGPLQVPRTQNSCLYDIIGITSFGKGCANPNTVGVYTRISEFVPWIERIVWNEP